MKAKRLESKVAKTTGLLTAAVISSSIPVLLFPILGNVVPLFRTKPLTGLHRHLFSWTLYLIRCFTVIETNVSERLLASCWGSKSLNWQSVVGAAQFLRQKDPVSSLELHLVGKRIQHLKRSLSCNLTGALDSVHGPPSVITLKGLCLLLPLTYLQQLLRWLGCAAAFIHRWNKWNNLCWKRRVMWSEVRHSWR